MRPIPEELRNKIADDPFMKTCIYKSIGAPNHKCSGRITWEHAWLYGKTQINEAFAIVPCCMAHNSGAHMVKDYNRYRALIRADIKDLERRMPKKPWAQILKHLKSLYDTKPDKNNNRG